MAEFSKEYTSRYMPDMPHDFSIQEEYLKLKEGYYISFICEGFGFIAIGNINGCSQVYYQINIDEGQWVPVELITDRTYSEYFMRDKLKKILLYTEDDCAPDAREQFEKYFFKFTGVELKDFKKGLKNISGTDDVWTIEGLVDGRNKYQVTCSAGDQVYKLYRIPSNGK